MRTLRRTLLLLAALLAALFGAVQPASAHTGLVSSSPKDGADLAKAPDRLTLTFDEAVDLADVRVLTVDGDRLPVSGTAKKSVVRVALNSPADGRFAVVWSVVDEEDGHASSGRIAFTAGTAATRADGDESPAAAPAPSPSVRKGLVAVRWAGYLALALFVGGLAFVALLWPGGTHEPRARALLGL
ncbi:copper resistance CopC family protein, partial [Streptomyces sp. NRRL WC-3774]